MSDIQLKRALLEECELLLRYRQLYSELIEGFSSLLKETVTFADKNGIGVSERERLYKIMQRAYELEEEGDKKLSSLRPRDLKHAIETRRDEIEPKILYRQISQVVNLHPRYHLDHPPRNLHRHYLH